MQPNFLEYLEKMSPLLLLAGTFIWFVLSQQKLKSTKDANMDSRFDVVDTKNDQQDEHLEFQDKKFESFKDEFKKLSDQIGQLGIFHMRIKQLEKENVERKQENTAILNKLDEISRQMMQLTINVNNKVNK